VFMAKKPKQNQPPRRKRMKRPQRLESAKSWLKTYGGNKVVKDYRKRYGVDFECAFTELALLGVPIDPDYKPMMGMPNALALFIAMMKNQNGVCMKCCALKDYR
jgi:hypothetical protein